MIKIRFISPYVDNKTRFPARKKPGVYLIKEKKSGQIVYVGMSESDVYKAMYHHFNSWNDKRSERAVYDRDKHLIRIVYCTFKQASRLERALIKRINPRDNSQKYEAFQNELSDRAIMQEYENCEFKPINEIPF